MRVLVTGATGLLGNNIVRQLLERSDDVRVLVRESSDHRPLDGLTVDSRLGDVTDAESVRNAAAGVDVVIHSAAHIHIGWRHFDVGRRVNVQGTQNVAQAAKDVGARLVHISTVDTLGVGAPDQPADEESPRHGKPLCCYVATKREAEQAVHDMVGDGLDAVIVNPGFMLGPWDWKPSSGRMLVEVTKRFRPATPSGGCSVCDVRDVARGVIQAIDRGQPGRNYILAGENLTYFDLWSLFAEIAGRRKPVFRLRKVGPYLAGQFGDLRAKLSGKESDVNSAMISMSQIFHFYSSQRASDELGYQFRPARTAVQSAWDWFVEHEYVRPTNS